MTTSTDTTGAEKWLSNARHLASICGVSIIEEPTDTAHPWRVRSGPSGTHLHTFGSFMECYQYLRGMAHAFGHAWNYGAMDRNPLDPRHTDKSRRALWDRK